MNAFFRNIIIIISVFVISVSLGTLLLVGAYALPTTDINNHIIKSVDVFEQEGTYRILTNLCTSQLDNWTDSVMFLNAGYDGEETLINKALMVYRKETEGLTPTQGLVKYYTEGSYTHIWSYARYWHGYLIFLKPLLCFFDYQTLRIINLIAQTGINLILVLIMYKKNLKYYIVPYVLSFLLIMPISTAYSFQFSTVFYVFSIGSIILIIKSHKWNGTNKFNLYFLILGIITSYFDLISYPLVSFGVPITFYYCLNLDKNTIKNFKKFTKYLCFWGMGYVGMWGGKWIIASILTNNNVFLDAYNMILVRSSMNVEGTAISFLDVLWLNLTSFLYNPLIVLSILFVIIMITMSLKKNLMKNLFKKYNIFFVIAMLPFAWYLGASNHSYVHFWFTYKELIITAFAAMCMLTKVIVDRYLGDEYK